MSRGATRPRPDTRAELLAAARRVIQREGFAGATVGEITSEGGASLGLLNYHFGSKDEIVAQAFAEIALGELAELEEIARRPEPAAERLVAYLDASDWGGRESWAMWIDAWGGAPRLDALQATLARYAQGWRAALADVLADGAGAGEWTCADPDETAARLVAVIDGIGLQAIVHPREVPPERASAWARRVASLELGVALPERPAPRTPAPERTTFELRMPIRGRDLDAGGTVHPAVQLAFLEEARGAWLDERLAGAERPLLARVAMDFRGALRPADGEVVVSCALRRAGRSSIGTDETITTAAGELVVRADATLVAVDPQTRRPRTLTPAEREALSR